MKEFVANYITAIHIVEKIYFVFFIISGSL